jgi:hypothetical protein
MVTMSTPDLPPRDRTASAPDLEALARDMQVPLDDVAQLYAREFAALAAGARITSFLPILATRKVRTLLRQRRHPRATPATAKAPTQMPSRAAQH